MRNIFLIFSFICSAMSTFAQEQNIKDQDKLVFTNNKAKVYQNSETKLYTIKRGKFTKFKNLNYVTRICGNMGCYLQVLDDQNNTYILDEDLKKTKNRIFHGLCGTVPHYTYRIIERGDYFVVTEDETFMDAENEIPPMGIDSILKEGIDDIYFPNKTKEVSYTTNLPYYNYTAVYPKTLLIKKGKKVGIVKKDKTIDFYDEVIGENYILKVKNKGLWGYYKITKAVKYKELSPFNYTLASIQLKNGKRGYIDTKGNEYYKR